MGAGKTTVGRRLAKSLGMVFHDSDREIEKRTGADISLIFDIEGEAGFRKREKNAINDLSAMDNLVLATGGGAIIDKENRNKLSSRGMVVYLQASVDSLYKRTSKDQKRPLLQTQDPKAKLQELLEYREPLYLEVADMVVNTDESSVSKIVKEIQEQFARSQAVENESTQTSPEK